MAERLSTAGAVEGYDTPEHIAVDGKSGIGKSLQDCPVFEMIWIR